MIPYIDFHTHHPSPDADVLSIQNTIAGKEEIPTEKLFSVGIHPMFITESELDNDFFALEKNTLLKNCIAIGECGLDRRSPIPIEQQISIFSTQILLAEKIQKPLVIHCVKAFSELIALKKKLKVSVPTILHGFNNNENIFLELQKNDFYFSFGNAILQPNSNALMALKKVSHNRFFLETDDIKSNIKENYKTASTVLRIEENLLKELIFNNLSKINQPQ